MTTGLDSGIGRRTAGDAVVIATDSATPSPARLASLRRIAGEALARQGDRWRLWAPVAFGGGCAFYFSLPDEPHLWALIGAAVVFSGIWLTVRRGGAGRWVTVPLMVLACLTLGLASAKLRTERVIAPIAPTLDEPVRIEGWVVDVDSPGGRGGRVVLAPVPIEGLASDQTPLRLRATVRGPPPPPGAAVSIYAVLNPPPPPASPGAYDFGRNAFFQGLGGVAFALSETRPASLPDPPRGLDWRMKLNALRFGLAQRIVARLGEESGGIAAAMTTGHEAWIAQADLDAMRDSGLAHILSISGLHMAIVGGFVFFAVRLGVAAWPWLALRVPGKKVAATAGLIAVGVYLAISGAPPPAERAATTASIAFIAVLLDRRAISMNALAAAAFVVLAQQPESIVQPGFQMSFAATAALVALAEAWPVRAREISAPWPITLAQSVRGWIVAACAASLVAGLATGPFAMQHFNRTAVFGLLANVATAPISSFVMMPALAVGAALEPLGLGGPFLAVAGRGVEAMLGIGRFTAGLPGAVRTIASAPTIALPIAFIGVLFLSLWRGRSRWLGLPLAAAVLIWPRAAPPDLWIGDGGTNAAIRQGEAAVLVRPGVRLFPAELWSKRRGLTLTDRPDVGWSCGRYACAPELAGPLAISWSRRPPAGEALAAMCRSAEVVSLRAAVAGLPPECDGRLVLDGTDHARGGAVELWRDGGGWRASWTRAARGNRPWVSDSGA